MVDLIANPELFNGMKVLVTGYVHVEFEGRGIYLDRDEFLYSLERPIYVSTKSWEVHRDPKRTARVSGIGN